MTPTTARNNIEPDDASDFRLNVVRALIDRTRTPVIVHDGVRVRHANAAARRLFGMERPSPRLEEIAVWRPDLAAPLDRVQIRCDDGRRIWLSAEHVPLFVGQDWNIATFFENPAEVAVPVERLAALERSQLAGVLSAGLAHELASPMVPLLAALDSMADQIGALCRRAGGAADPVLQTLSEGLETAAVAAGAVASVLHDFQGFIRPRAPASTDELCDPLLAVDRAIRMARPRIRGLAALSVSLAPVPMVRAPSGFLTQIALNLCNNAADALATRGSRRGRIDVRLREEEGRIVLEVHDDGPGIAPEVMARLFQPMVTTKSDPTSLGMGLAICRALVQRCGGDITASSRPGEGTTFRVSLPRAVVSS